MNTDRQRSQSSLLPPLQAEGPSPLAWAGATLIGLTSMVLFGAGGSGVTATDTIVFLALVAVFASTLEVARWIPSGRSGQVFTAVVLGAAVLSAYGARELTFVELHVLPVVGALAISWLAVSLASLLGRLSQRAVQSRRVAIIGSARAAENLRRELSVGRARGYEVVGWISPDAKPLALVDGSEQCLGSLSSLGAVVRSKRVNLLLMSAEASRLAVFDEIAASCLELPVRFCELSSFHEDVFGHVPVSDINASWFQYIMHPRYSQSAPRVRRLGDIAASALLAVIVAPLMLVAMLLIRRDGGPAIFEQVRVGESGRPFMLYKLRTMRPSASVQTQWADNADPRITPIGRLLRRSHLDELPQLYNVLRGDMSLVGPRPEQPDFVDRLERTVPFYQRRHLIKPGITGWAQVRCGYAGSDRGSLWKLAHDLYYVKHRSLALDVAILWETVREVALPRPHEVGAESVGWVFADLDPTSNADGEKQEALQSA